MSSIYPMMTELLVDESPGTASISKFTVPEGSFGALLAGVTSGEYVKLIVSSQLMMSNTNMEKRTNLNFVRQAHGNVLIGGLGIGLIILAIQDKPNVSSITVIENNQDVIDMITRQLKFNNKVSIICDDVFSYTPIKGTRYNTIYMDIWPWINSDVYQNEMKPLISRYRKYLVSKQDDPNRYIDCWCKYQAKNDLRI